MERKEFININLFPSLFCLILGKKDTLYLSVKHWAEIRARRPRTQIYTAKLPCWRSKYEINLRIMRICHRSGRCDWELASSRSALTASVENIRPQNDQTPDTCVASSRVKLNIFLQNGTFNPKCSLTKQTSVKYLGASSGGTYIDTNLRQTSRADPCVLWLQDLGHFHRLPFCCPLRSPLFKFYRLKERRLQNCNLPFKLHKLT